MQAKSLTPILSVGPQLNIADLAAAAERFRAIINNRPDGEEPGQPSSAEIQAEAERLGLQYRHIPIAPGQFPDDCVRAFADALTELEGPVFAFCRTGTRSTSLWALTQAARGTPNGALRAAAEAGYDLRALWPRLDQVAQHPPTSSSAE